MFTFLKVQVASVLGSIADYLVTILLVEIFDSWYLIANFTGNIIGGSVQFILCRNWIFFADKKKLRIQMIKFTIVFIGNLILSAVGIYLFTSCFHINYIVSKTIVSIILGVTYNYYMQKKFVFR